MRMLTGGLLSCTLRRSPVLLACLFSLAMAMVGAKIAHAQSPLDGFAPNFNNEVRALALQSDGRLLVGGAFTQVGLAPRNRLVRLAPDGVLDVTFNVNVNQTVHALAVDANDRILVGGAFTQVSGKTRNHIARLTADGVLDDTFAPNINGTVYALCVLADGSILVAGDFTTVDGAPRAYLARLDGNGAIAPEFVPELNGPVYALALQSNGAAVIGGAFTAIDGESRAHLARVNTDGALDPGFAPELDAAVRALAIGFGDTIVAGGDFTEANGAACSRLAHFTMEGGLASAPALSFDDSIHSVAVQEDGRIVVGGAFTTVNSQPFGRLVRITVDGILDPMFAPSLNGAVYALIIQSDDKLVAGGAFTLAGDELRGRLARFYQDGSLDADFAPSADQEVNHQVTAIAIQPDGRIVVGGTFIELAGQSRLRLARFYPDGRLDADFNPGANHDVRALAIQPDGKIIVAGNFTRIAEQNRSFIVRLTSSGQIDETFAPFPSDGVIGILAVALQPDGKIVISMEPQSQQDKRPRLLRLNGDGSVDATFQTPIDNDYVVSLAIQPDNRIIACGGFTVVSENVLIEHLARLDPSGAIDATFTPDVSICRAIALLPDGRIIFSGTPINSLYAQEQGNVTQRLMRINASGVTDNSFVAALAEGYVSAFTIQADGNILVANNYEDSQGISRSRVLRLTSSGAADQSFTVNDANGRILAIALQRDGKAVLGGGFTEISALTGTPVQRVWLARLSAPTAAQQSLRVESDGMTFVWQVRGALPTLTRTTFAYSTDGATFIPIGVGVWTPEGWQVSESGAPFNQQFFVRASGDYASCVWNASVSRLESTSRMSVPGGTLEVVTEIDPQGLTPLWRVNVTGNTFYSDTLSGADTTGIRGVGLGVYTVTLSAESSDAIEDYRITHRCTINEQDGPTGAGSVVTLTVGVNDSIQCLFTAVRRTGLLEVQHVIEPTAPASEWIVHVSGPTAYTSTLTGDASTGAKPVFTGLYTLGLAQNGAVGYTTSYRCDADGQPLVSGEGLQASLNITEAQQVTCIFHSVRNQIPIYLPVITR